MNRPTWEQMADEVTGTSMSPGALIEKYELDVDIEDVEEALLECDVETCPVCGWWVDSWEMVEHGDAMVCEGCYWETHEVLAVPD